MRYKLHITDHRTFSKPLVTCDQCKHYNSVRPGGKRLCLYWGQMMEPDDFCSRSEKREGEEVR